MMSFLNTYSGFDEYEVMFDKFVLVESYVVGELFAGFVAAVVGCIDIVALDIHGIAI